MDDVVGVAPGRGPIAVRPAAVTVAGGERAAHRARDHAPSAADVDHD